jgi:uncharacterized RmlC-like cupin family protein
LVLAKLPVPNVVLRSIPRSVFLRPSGAGFSRSSREHEPASTITASRKRSHSFFPAPARSAGARGEFVAYAKAGDFIHVPAFLPHMESNLSNERPFRWVVVRSTPSPIVVNLPDAVWPDADAVRPTDMI